MKTSHKILFIFSIIITLVALFWLYVVVGTFLDFQGLKQAGSMDFASALGKAFASVFILIFFYLFVVVQAVCAAAGAILTALLIPRARRAVRGISIALLSVNSISIVTSVILAIIQGFI